MVLEQVSILLEHVSTIDLKICKGDQGTKQHFGGAVKICPILAHDWILSIQ